MHMLPRTLWHLWVTGPKQTPIEMHAVSTSRFRVWPTDLDILRHMNNGKYLSIMDVGRFELMKRSGILEIFQREGWYPVVVAQTISYRKSLNPWMRFDIESRIIGFDDQAVYIEQRFVRPDQHGKAEIYARAIVRGRILRRSGGVVRVDEIVDKTGIDLADFQVPEEILQWGQTSRLPSTRDIAPSHW